MHYLFEVTAKPGYTIEQYAEAWVRASELIQQAPGAQGTRLHRKIGEERTALAIATWESKAARDASPASFPGAVQEIIESQAPFVEIRFIGEFEAPQWEVLPPDWQQTLSTGITLVMRHQGMAIQLAPAAAACATIQQCDGRS